MKIALIVLLFVSVAACGPGGRQPETKTDAVLPAETADAQRTDAMQEEKDLKCTHAEMAFLSNKLVGVPGWDPNTQPWKQIGNDFFFIPESISGSGGQPDVVILMAKVILAEMPPT